MTVSIHVYIYIYVCVCVNFYYIYIHRLEKVWAMQERCVEGLNWEAPPACSSSIADDEVPVFADPRYCTESLVLSCNPKSHHPAGTSFRPEP